MHPPVMMMRLDSSRGSLFLGHREAITCEMMMKLTRIVEI
jgi:hypothetical protein